MRIARTNLPRNRSSSVSRTSGGILSTSSSRGGKGLLFSASSFAARLAPMDAGSSPRSRASARKAASASSPGGGGVSPSDDEKLRESSSTVWAGSAWRSGLAAGADAPFAADCPGAGVPGAFSAALLAARANTVLSRASRRAIRAFFLSRRRYRQQELPRREPTAP